MGFGQQTDEELDYPAAYLALDHPDWSLGYMVGRSPIMQRLFAQMRSTAPHLRIAMIEGESGAGKTAAARTLHSLGPAAARIFLPCPASQFFEQLPSVAREARDGTLLLSHIEDLTPAQQLRLLEFLQWLDHQHARHMPESAPRQVFFSSNVAVRKLVSAFSLRIDLANRLTVIRFTVPPLRERREDISLMAEYFAQRFSATHQKAVLGVGPQALPRLLTHLWPGNARELESVIHAAALGCEGHWIRPIDIPPLAGSISPWSSPPNGTAAPAQGAAGNRADEDPNLDHAIYRHVSTVLARVDGNKLRAARLLGISRSTLYRLLDSSESSR